MAAEVLFDNGAGMDPPSVLLGRPVGGLPIGTFAADVTLYLPKTADQIEAETSRPSPIRMGQDLGLTTVTGSIAVRGGGSTSLTVAYVVPDAVRTVNGAKEVTLRRVPQPTMAGDPSTRSGSSLPDGSTIVSASPAMDSARRRRGVLRRARRARGSRPSIRTGAKLAERLCSHGLDLPIRDARHRDPFRIGDVDLHAQASRGPRSRCAIVRALLRAVIRTPRS